MTKARLVTVVIEKTSAGLLRATSPDFHGLHVAGHTVDGVKESVRKVLEEMLLAMGESVTVYETEVSESGLPPPWVIVPTKQFSSHC